jgi:hypothetical protein
MSFRGCYFENLYMWKLNITLPPLPMFRLVNASPARVSGQVELAHSFAHVLFFKTGFAPS